MSALPALLLVSALAGPVPAHGLSDEVAVALLSVCGEHEASDVLRRRIVAGLDTERTTLFEEGLSETMAVARHTPCAPGMHLRAIGIAKDLRRATAR